MQRLAQEVWRREPALLNADASVGELAWIWGGRNFVDGARWKQRVWPNEDAPAAWGWITPQSEWIVSEGSTQLSGAVLSWQTHPDSGELLDEILDWFEAEAPEPGRQTFVRAANEDALRRLARHGYRHDINGPWSQLNIRPLYQIGEPRLPAGYAFKTMRELEDVSRRVEVHRAAWERSALTDDAYAHLMTAWPYRDDLDFVIEAPDGMLAASAIGWYDDTDRTGEFEPVGTHPAHRRQGLGRALMLLGLQRFRDAGATQAIVGCRGDDAYPVPKQLYQSVGFVELTRELPFVHP
jgi:GNAT superfamily N-acetyltransferase